MIEKGKTYTYEELEEIIIQAGAKTLEKLSNDTEEIEGIGKLMFTMNTMMIISAFTNILLVGDGKDEPSSN